MAQLSIDVRSVHRGVASSAPASASAQKSCVHGLTNKNLAAQGGDLRMAFETKVIVPLDQHLVRDRPVRLVTSRAAFAQSFVLKDHRSGLLAMALRATFIQRREASRRPDAKRRAVRGLENIPAMRIVALDAIHSPFKDGVMLGQFELRVDIEVAVKARLRFTAGIDDKPSPTARLHVQTPRTVTGFATGVLPVRRSFELQPRVGIGRERARKVRMALRTRLVADKSRSVDFRRCNCALRKRGTGSQK